MPEGKQQERPPRKAKMQLNRTLDQIRLSKDKIGLVYNDEPGDVDNCSALSQGWKLVQ